MPFMALRNWKDIHNRRTLSRAFQLCSGSMLFLSFRNLRVWYHFNNIVWSQSSNEQEIYGVLDWSCLEDSDFPFSNPKSSDLGDLFRLLQYIQSGQTPDNGVHLFPTTRTLMTHPPVSTLAAQHPSREPTLPHHQEKLPSVTMVVPAPPVTPVLPTLTPDTPAKAVVPPLTIRIPPVTTRLTTPFPPVTTPVPTVILPLTTPVHQTPGTTPSAISPLTPVPPGTPITIPISATPMPVPESTVSMEKSCGKKRKVVGDSSVAQRSKKKCLNRFNFACFNVLSHF